MPKVGADAAQIGLADAGWLVLARADDGIPFRMVAFTKSENGFSEQIKTVTLRPRWRYREKPVRLPPDFVRLSANRPRPLFPQSTSMAGTSPAMTGEGGLT
jgi:hypothetical protein